jgi:hypothetical protein
MTGIGFIINLLNKVPNPDEPELNIEDCKLNICGCRSRSAGAACRSVHFEMERIP